MQDSIESVFQSELLPGERIHWTGQPDPSVIFSSSDLFAIPFSLLWGGLAVNWELTVLGYPSLLTGNHPRPTHSAPVFFALWGIPFVGMGLYMIFGRFFYKAWRKSRTYYALTDKRALVITQTRGQQVQALFLNQIPVINKSIRANGSGSLIFGNMGPGQMYGNTGMDFFGARYNQGALAFYDIHQVEGVYSIVNQLRDKAL